MNEPDFSTAYRTTDTAVAVAAGPQTPIESASASTACQTNSSKFAYVLTFSVLGVIALVLIAIGLLFFMAYTSYDSYYTDAYSSPHYSWGYNEDYDGPYADYFFDHYEDHVIG